jgi:hypothetical protein
MPTLYELFYFILDGKFAAYMQVEIQNDGPVTIHVDSRATKTQVEYSSSTPTPPPTPPPLTCPWVLDVSKSLIFC